MVTAFDPLACDRRERQDVGIIWLERAAPCDTIADLGILIGEPEYRGLAIGRRAIQLAEVLARSEWSIERVRLRVRKGNQRAISCYQKSGFEISGASDKQLGEERIGVFEMTHDLSRPYMAGCNPKGAGCLTLVKGMLERTVRPGFITGPDVTYRNFRLSPRTES